MQLRHVAKAAPHTVRIDPETISEVLMERFGGANVQLQGPVSVRDLSQVFRAHIAAPVSMVAAVKFCLAPDSGLPDPQAARAQFDGLARVHLALDGKCNHLRVPVPLHIFPDLAGYAMSWVDGESLTKKMRQLNFVTRCPGWFEDAGHWLGNFHLAGPMRMQPLDLSERLADIDRYKKLTPPDGTFDTVATMLAQSAAALEGVEGPVSWLHGDCKTDNYMMSGGDVYGIDFSLAHENPVEYDIAQFLNSLELMLLNPRYLHLRGFRANLEERFILGYKKCGLPLSEPFLNWLRLFFGIWTWRNLKQNHKRSLRMWLMGRMCAKMVARQVSSQRQRT